MKLPAEYTWNRRVRFAADLAADDERGVELDAVFLERLGIAVEHVAHRVTHQPRRVGHGARGEQAGLGAGDALAQQAGDRLADGEVARGQQHDDAFARHLEESHLAESADVVHAGIGARVRQEHQAFIDLDADAIRHRISLMVPARATLSRRLVSVCRCCRRGRSWSPNRSGGRCR